MIALQFVDQVGFPAARVARVERAVDQQLAEADGPWQFGGAQFERQGWKVYVRLVPKAKACNGTHKVNSTTGVPYAVVKWNPLAKCGTGSWPYILSHEVLEMVTDPYSDTYNGTGRMIDGRFVEVGDPVIGYGYWQDGVFVSDYVLPAEYTAGSAGPWDRLGLLPGSLSVSPRGYLCGPSDCLRGSG